jgi:dihydroorotase
MIVIRGGEVLIQDGWTTSDVAVEHGRIEAIAPSLTGDVEIDGADCLVGPGFVDMHTHLRDPGQTWKEDITSGSAAAAAGGFTAITAMPNTDPAMDSPAMIESVLRTARDVGRVEIVPSAALTIGRSGAVPVDVDPLYRLGVRIFTDDGDSVADSRVLSEVMTRIAALPGAFVAQHAEETSRTAGGHMHDGAMSRKLGVAGLPAEAEADVVARDLSLTVETGAHYHCQHVSAKMTVDLIREAKESGLAVTAEVTPHHLTFDESDVADLDPDFKMYPPLRSREDRDALLEAVQDGTIDVVATDHAPHLPEEKQVGFVAAPRGVIGLETAASAVWAALGDRNRLFDVLSQTPARLLGLADQGQPLERGAVANLVVFDPNEMWTAGSFVSKSSNSPYKGRLLTGRVRATLHRGSVVHQSRVLSA